MKKKKDKIDTPVTTMEQLSTVTWNYAHQADLTIGEKKVSKLAKVLLIILVMLIIAGIALSYTYKDNITDYLTNPKLTLVNDEVTLEVGSEFDCKNYLVSKDFPERYVIEYPSNEEVDTLTLGTYEIKYKLITSITEDVQVLKVNVVDTTPPVITLTVQYETFAIKEGDKNENIENFDPKDYIVSVTDNYDSEEDIELIYDTTFDWTQEEVVVNYSATDSSGNIGGAKLTIILNKVITEVITIEVPVEPPESSSSSSTPQESSSSRPPQSSSSVPESSSSTPESSSSSVPESSSSKPQESSSSTPPSSSSTPESSSSKPEESSSTPPPQPDPYISGVHDFTMKVGDIDFLISESQRGVSGSGTISIDFSRINYTVPGTYELVYTSTYGITKIAYITVVE